MQEITPREKILKKIRQALIEQKPLRFPSVDWDTNVYKVSEESLEEQFANAFSKVGGHFVYCESELEFLENLVAISQENNWKNFYCREESLLAHLEKVDFPVISEERSFPEEMVAITSCEALIARLGSILISSRQGSGRRLFVVPTVHVVLAYTSQLVPDIHQGMQLIRKKYMENFPSFLATITGPSRTADIEKTLVTPAHGPRDLFVFLVDG